MQQRFRLSRFPVDEGGPGEQRAYRAARGSAQGDDLVVGHHVGLQQPTEDAGGEGGMATPTLAGDGHPDRFDLLVHQHSFVRFGLRCPL